MRRGRTTVRWLAVGFTTLGLLRVAPAAERLRAGDWDLGVAGGFSVSVNPGGQRDVDSVHGVHLLPHVGYLVTDEVGPGAWRGTLEILAEPTLSHFRDGGESATVAGLAALGRWIFAGMDVVRPYVEAGVGVLGGQTEFRQTDCNLNFVLQGGFGVQVFVAARVAVTAGARYHHVSNADRCERNLGLNSALFLLGLSYFTP